MNAVEIEEAVSELASVSFDAAEFPFAFLAAFGNRQVTVQRLRAGSGNASDVVGGVLQRNNIHMAVCAEGRVSETLSALRTSPKTAINKVKFILATDGVMFEAEELMTGEALACAYPKFSDHFAFFLPLAGISTIKQIKDNPVDIKATGRLNKLYIELLKDNPDWAGAERRHDLNHFMARLIFCLFAEDTGIFLGNSLFSATVERMSDGQSSNTHEVISELFRSMNTKLDERATSNFRPWADAMPYVNGGLFSGSADCPKFSKIARSYLLRAAALNWQEINPDIFGSMIQAVADEEERGALGMHYTSVPNILKVLNPLFLDDLRVHLEQAGDNARSLLNLRKRIAKIRVFDPACGSGNFLVIAYKQMRAIEAEINRRRGEADRRTEIRLTNFRGIELRDFPAEIARLALIIAEYQSDVVYRGQQEALAAFLPLDTQNWITCGNALRLDWLSLWPPTGTRVKLLASDLFETPLDQAQIDFENEGGETYICGNPPYLGSKWQSDEQKSDLASIFAHRISSWKSLDYVAGWFMKAADYGRHTVGATALVSTNSICQGQLVPVLWPAILETGARIHFAYNSFKWANLASHNAVVTVVVVGMTHADIDVCKLFEMQPDGELVERQVDNINAYLIPAPNIVIDAARLPLNSLSPMVFGNMPRDAGYLLMDDDERRELIRTNPASGQYLKWFQGADDFISGRHRACVWVDEKGFAEASAIPELAARFDGVKRTRLESNAESTRSFAAKPYRFVQIQGVAQRSAIIVPRHSSERREYLPVGLIDSDVIVADSALAIYDAELWNIAILLSKLHLIWVAAVCGKIKTDYRYSNTIGWNTFPVPFLTAQNRAALTLAAENILLAREAHFPATVGELYDPDKMPSDLRKAHEANDETVERVYIGRKFKNDTERLEKLFQMYADKSTGKVVLGKTA
ncbi:lactate dehydrogenase [Caulobacter sp. Root1455]|uniref:class I SAM-dependent DNA methyltransferase n=1 Tax=Caulobacter sp. Root1455 TaxID=1736465 RepID=UPI0006FD0563|nr:DNA methyltransferase [Caulobacter sp. Root1455]KQY95918.1 lactate dehydrogenase [Caulobacter sp. Root1455]